MFDDLKDKRILVTGASQGIGLAAALAFARMGARVGITSRAFDEHAQSAMAQLKAIGADAEHFPGDLSQTLACEQLVERFAARFGGIDVLVNNAGGLVGRKQLSGPNYLQAVGKAELPHLFDLFKVLLGCIHSRFLSLYPFALQKHIIKPGIQFPYSVVFSVCYYHFGNVLDLF